MIKISGRYINTSIRDIWIDFQRRYGFDFGLDLKQELPKGLGDFVFTDIAFADVSCDRVLSILKERAEMAGYYVEPKDSLPSRKSHFEVIAEELGKLVTEKNLAYGDSSGKSGEFLKLLYPNGIQPEQYADALLLVRIFDKQMRIATKKDAFGESPYRDIAGYGILGAANAENRNPTA